MILTRKTLLELCFIYIIQIFPCDGMVTPFHKLGNIMAKGQAGKPLFLTPYLDKGFLYEAQALSRVNITSDLGFRSHSGFFTVNKKYNSNMFFWYFPAINEDLSAPLILWLQGGPGASSMFGLFIEIGPLIPLEHGFQVREHHWAQKYHLIFIDNPVGTGFSFTNNDLGYCNDETCVAVSLYEALRQFYQMFPELMGNELYLAGESYAGKYLPTLAMFIHNKNTVEDRRMNLKGLAMGNAYCDPITQIDYGTYLYQHGLIDFKQQEVFNYYQMNIVDAIKSERWKSADILMDTLMDGNIGNFSFFKDFTGYTDYYNFLETEDQTDLFVFADMLANTTVRRNVHVGNLPFNNGLKVMLHLAEDILKSVAPLISELLSHYRILFYNGQLDIIVAYPLTEAFLRNLKFSSSEEYLKAPRNIWRIHDDIAGYFKRAGNLTEILIRNAGHMVPKDQPVWAHNMIDRFIRDTF